MTGRSPRPTPAELWQALKDGRYDWVNKQIAGKACCFAEKFVTVMCPSWEEAERSARFQAAWELGFATLAPEEHAVVLRVLPNIRSVNVTGVILLSPEHGLLMSVCQKHSFLTLRILEDEEEGGQ